MRLCSAQGATHLQRDNHRGAARLMVAGPLEVEAAPVTKPMKAELTQGPVHADRHEVVARGVVREKHGSIVVHDSERALAAFLLQ